MRVAESPTLQKAGLVVAILGIVIAAIALINDLTSHDRRADREVINQSTSGDDSPAIANVRGSVTIERRSR